MTKQELLASIKKITGGKRFIETDVLQELMELPYCWVDHCGTSGTGKGSLYTFYLMDEDGEKTNEEICEIVVLY